MIIFALLAWEKGAVQERFCFDCSSGADSPRSSEPLPLAVAKEAKVSDMEDDQLGEEDVVFLDDTWVLRFLLQHKEHVEKCIMKGI